MPRAGKTAPAARTEGKLYLAKAEEFLREARIAAQASRHDAAMLNAIHAAISAADAVTTVLAGHRSADPDHQRTVDLLEEVAGPSAEIRNRARQMNTLLAKKNVVEYESRRATAKEAGDAVESASRIVVWAMQVVRRSKV
jgi:HEPN domain-containing protein